MVANRRAELGAGREEVMSATTSQTPAGIPNTLGVAVPRVVAALVRSVGDQSPAPVLDDDEIDRRLQGSSDAVVKEALAATQKLHDAEIARHARIEDKAKSLVTAAGASVTFLLTLSGAILTYGPQGKLAHHGIGKFALAGVLLDGVLGVAAVVYGVRALFMSQTYQTLSQATVLGEGALTYKGGELRTYLGVLIMETWTVLHNQFAKNEEKAALVKTGQGIYLAFLVLLAFVVFIASGVVAFG